MRKMTEDIIQTDTEQIQDDFAPLHLNLHAECLKLDDPRINKVRRGKMSLEVFALLLEPGDPFVVIGDTIYALTEQEYYATRSLISLADAVEDTFKKMLELKDISFMSDEDKDFMDRMKKDLPGCPTCRFKRYKDSVYQIAKRYNIAVNNLTKNQAEIKPYPKLAVRANGRVSDPVLPMVSTIMQHMYKMPAPDRKSCVECVRKHTASAYVLAGECYTGYPEHIALVNAHLGEAIDEMPKTATALRDTLEFCMAKTAYTGQPFVPLGAILTQLKLISDMSMVDVDQPTEVRTEAPTTLELEVSNDCKEFLTELPESLKGMLRQRIELVEDSILKYKNDPSDANRAIWEGTMSVLAEKLAQLNPSLANVIRNRRLLFRGDPPLMIESGYSMQDILQYM